MHVHLSYVPSYQRLEKNWVSSGTQNSLPENKHMLSPLRGLMRLLYLYTPPVVHNIQGLFCCTKEVSDIWIIHSANTSVNNRFALLYDVKAYKVRIWWALSMREGHSVRFVSSPVSFILISITCVAWAQFVGKQTHTMSNHYTREWDLSLKQSIRGTSFFSLYFDIDTKLVHFWVYYINEQCVDISTSRTKALVDPFAL